MTAQQLAPTVDSTAEPGPISHGPAQRPAVPYIEILHHSDLRLWGCCAQPDELAEGNVVAIGRSQPTFSDPYLAKAQPQQLADPCISSKQVEVRWSSAEDGFFIKSAPSGRRVVTVSSPGEPFSTPDDRLYPPDTLIRIEDRLLLRLAVRRVWVSQTLGMWGQSDLLWQLRQDLTDAAAFDEPVLLTGRPGAGKERAAQAVRLASSRAEGVFNVINCSAIPTALLESQLFGYEKGAFNGADKPSPGLVRDSEGGTLFLDEIGELSSELQAKLLRLIEYKCVQPLGRAREVKVNVRFISATNRNLQEEVEAGRFREDLYYRLKVLPVEVPSLGQRPVDVPVIFSRSLLEQLKKHPEREALVRNVDRKWPPISVETVLQMMAWSWPGNVRELNNTITQALSHSLRVGRFTWPSGSHLSNVSVVSSMNVRAAALKQQPAATPRSERITWEQVHQKPQLLVESLGRHRFEFQSVAKEMGVTHTTIENWKRRLKIKSPLEELTADQLRAQYEQCDGDDQVIADNVGVTLRAVRKRARALGVLGPPG